MVMLAKGNRSQQVTDACHKHGGFYLGSIGGPAAVLAQQSIRAADASKVEAAVFMAGIGHLLAAVAFRQHHHARAVGLQQINVRVHAAGSGWAGDAGKGHPHPAGDRCLP